MRVEAKARARVCRTPEPRSRHKFGCVAEQPLELARAAFPGVSGQSTRDTKKTQIDGLFSYEERQTGKRKRSSIEETSERKKSRG